MMFCNSKVTEDMKEDGHYTVAEAVTLSGILDTRKELRKNDNLIRYCYSVFGEDDITFLEITTTEDGKICDVHCRSELFTVDYLIVGLVFELEDNGFPKQYEYVEDGDTYKCIKNEEIRNVNLERKFQNFVDKSIYNTEVVISNKELQKQDIVSREENEITIKLQVIQEGDIHSFVNNYIFKIPGRYIVEYIIRQEHDKDILEEYAGFIGLIKDEKGKDKSNKEQYVVLLKDNSDSWYTYCASEDEPLLHFDTHYKFINCRLHYEMGRIWHFELLWGLKSLDDNVDANYTWESFYSRVAGKSICELREELMPLDELPANPLLDIVLVYRLMDPICPEDKLDYFDCIQDYGGEDVN